jgi:lipoprotein-anchoring transpeptidase ErfK/SrfK
MRRILLFIVALLILVTAALASFYIVQVIKPLTEQMAADTTFTPLPANKREAQRELLKARRTLDRLKPRSSYIVIDTHANMFYLRTERSILFKATCSTGTGGVLADSDTGRKWIFNTPRGVFKINQKIKQPWWRKPDWAFIEEGEKPPKSESDRLDPEMLGDYAMGFGDGYFIHGTIYERLLGVSVTHGCVRLGSEDLKYVYDRVRPGTAVYIF